MGLVGGARGDQEEPLDAALRELREETALIPTEPLMLFYEGIRPASAGSGTTAWHVFYGRTTADDADIVVAEGHDIRFLPAEVLTGANLGVSAAYLSHCSLHPPSTGHALGSARRRKEGAVFLHQLRTA